MDKFLNFYSKYPWTAIIIVIHWIATAAAMIYAKEIDTTSVMGVAFVATVLYAYFGFKAPKG
jgi:hypothetical protein